ALLLVPVVIALTGLLALGIGTLLAAMNVAYRDVKYVIPFLIQLWMFATPAIYLPSDFETSLANHDSKGMASNRSASPAAETPSTHPPASPTGQESATASLLRLNPMNGIVAFFRAAVLGGTLPWGQLAQGAALTAIALGLGLFYFRRVENTFADVI